MDVFCRCTGCGSCNGDAAIPTSGKCGNRPQKYTITGPDKTRHGYRKFCKPCLRKMELCRLATKHSLRLGLVPGYMSRCERAPYLPSVPHHHFSRARHVSLPHSNAVFLNVRIPSLSFFIFLREPFILIDPLPSLSRGHEVRWTASTKLATDERVPCPPPL